MELLLPKVAHRALVFSDEHGAWPLVAPPPQQGSADDDTWQPLVQTVPWVALPFLDEYDGQGLHLPALEVEDAACAAVQVNPWLAPVAAYDEMGSSLFRSLDYEQKWEQPVQGVPTYCRVPPVEPEQLGQPSFDDDTWTANTHTLPPYSKPYVATDVVPLLLLEQEDAWRAAVQALVRYVPAPTDEDAGQLLLAFPLDQEELREAALHPYPWVGRIAADEDPGSSLRVSGLDEEVAWTPQRICTSWQAVLHLDDPSSSTLAGFLLEQEDWQPARVQLVPWCAQPSVEEGSGSSLLATWCEEGDTWTQAVQLVAWKPLTFSDDEVNAGAQNFCLLDASLAVCAQQSVPWTARPFAAEASGSSLLTFSLLDEQPAEPARQAVPWNARVFTGTDALLQLPLDVEDAWQAPSRLGYTYLACSPADAADIVFRFSLEQEDGYAAGKLSSPWVAVSYVDMDAPGWHLVTQLIGYDTTTTQLVGYDA